MKENAKIKRKKSPPIALINKTNNAKPDSIGVNRETGYINTPNFEISVMFSYMYWY